MAAGPPRKYEGAGGCDVDVMQVGTMYDHQMDILFQGWFVDERIMERIMVQ